MTEKKKNVYFIGLFQQNYNDLIGQTKKLWFISLFIFYSVTYYMKICYHLLDLETELVCKAGFMNMS